MAVCVKNIFNLVKVYTCYCKIFKGADFFCTQCTYIIVIYKGRKQFDRNLPKMHLCTGKLSVLFSKICSSHY